MITILHFKLALIFMISASSPSVGQEVKLGEFEIRSITYIKQQQELTFTNFIFEKYSKYYQNHTGYHGQHEPTLSSSQSPV